ncbi:MAG: DUF1592 domain-containing protein [Isosphaeraceae bacterium]
MHHRKTEFEPRATLRGRDSAVWVVVSASLLVLVMAGPARAGDEKAAREESPAGRLDREYREQVRPVIQRFCLKCHSSEEPEADVDLQKFGSLDDARRGLATWQKVAAILDKGEMPPPDARQPRADERGTLRGWVGRYLDFEAHANAGDPGRVVLRRLSNVEYANTIRDLTGVDLDPAREFPQDGAAGEGFTNTGDALVMSPSLLGKYFDAAKGVAAHAVLLPDGFRFSRAATRRDWTDEIVAEIRRLYDRHADKDGKLPLEPYLTATIELRDSTAARSIKRDEIRDLAAKRGLSPRYLGIVWDLLNSRGPADGRGGLVNDLRTRWHTARSGDVPAMAGAIRQWQASLWRFKSVSYSFDGTWQLPVDPLSGSQALRHKIPAAPQSGEVVLYLAAGDAGDGRDGDIVVWRQPRLETPGRPPLLLRDVRPLGRYLAARRREILAATSRYLVAAAEAPPGCDRETIGVLARSHGVEADALAAWLDYLGIAGAGPVKIDSYFARKIPRGSGYDFIQGWGFDETPSLIANSSDREVTVPGRMKPHSVAVHPSPGLMVSIGWRSPISGRVRVAPTVSDAHGACGNGVIWSLELRRGGTHRRLAAGAIDDGKKASIPPIDDLPVQAGDMLSLRIGPRDGNHGCDLTEVDLEINVPGDKAGRWQLAPDVSGNILAGNPHADQVGKPEIWHFYTEPADDRSGRPVVPSGSLLARWLEASPAAEKTRLAGEIQRLLTSANPTAGKDKDSPDAVLARQANSLDGPLLGPIAAAARAEKGGLSRAKSKAADAGPSPDWGLDPGLFGNAPDGRPIDAESLCVSSPSVLEIRLPADLVAGREFVMTGELEPRAGAEGSVQLQLLEGRPGPLDRLRPGVPVLVRDGSRACARFAASMDEFRRVFPAALCFRQIIPVDEVVTMLQFFRGDEPLGRLMLDDAERARLDRLWDELHFVSQDAIKVYQNLDQMLNFASQENETAKVEAWRKPLTVANDAAVKVQAASEPKQIDSLLAFTARAYRRPLSGREEQELRALYQSFRKEKFGHEDALRFVMARVLVAPSFLYRVERPGPGSASQPVSDLELASRLSYFLWASMPDDVLRRVAGEGRLHDPDVLVAQARRLVRDDRVRGLATEFACQWLEIRDFDTHDEKSERHFPMFAKVRPDLHEEAIQFFVDWFRNDRSVLELIESDHAFLNESLAQHYGIPGVKGPEWRRVDGVKAHGRGGVLALGAILTKQSGASRTSPVLRGNWLLESLLGEKLPRPPKNVPQLPDDEAATDGLTVRQLVEKHRSVASCASCHNRIDPFGFALEAYDPIGRLRQKDLGGRPVDTRAELKDGTRFDGFDGLKNYILTTRKDEFLRNFCRKFLGYALGRSVQLSDEPLIDEMLTRLRASDFRVSAALETILRSQQFRYHRGLTRGE